MEIATKLGIEFTALVLLLTSSLCIADVNIQRNYQPYSLANLERWRSIFEKSQPQKDYSVPSGYFKMDDRNNQNNVIFEPDVGISSTEFLSDDLEPSNSYGIPRARALTPTLHSLDSRDNQPATVKMTFQSLCPSIRRTVYLNDTGFDYRPDHYQEVLCAHAYSNGLDYKPNENKICSNAKYACVQLSRTIYLTRKSPETDCWETETKKVFSSCECMWPKHELGDITNRH